MISSIVYALQCLRASTGIALLLIAALALPVKSHEHDTRCADGTALQHTFDSGASWSLCAHVSGVNALHISQAFFRAPGDLNRSVLAEAQLSQILLHYHDSPVEEPQIVSPSTNSAADSQIVILNDRSCDGQVLGTTRHPNSLCQRIKRNGILAKFNQRPSVQTESWELSSAITRETLIWNVSWTFTEDGQIRPRLSLSGRASRSSSNEQHAQQTRTDIPPMTRAAIVSTWRLVPALDTDAPDTLEQFDFPLDIDAGNRRPMQITPLRKESFLAMNRENFRGWRIIDDSGAGYYLDPANNGFNYTSARFNWANYTLALTRKNSCELYALGNAASTADTQCGTNLDDFVDDESLAGAELVVWFNQTRHIDPGIEDWPVIRDVQLGFDLLPFDWTTTSPFELEE